MASKYTARAAIQTILSTELNSLGNDTLSAVSSAVANEGSGERDVRGMFEIFIAAQGSARDSGAAVSLYLIPTVDDTNYGDEASEENYFVGSVAFDAATTARYHVLDRVSLPPSDFKVALKNSTGQALAATGNTVKYRLYGFEDV